MGVPHRHVNSRRARVKMRPRHLHALAVPVQHVKRVITVDVRDLHIQHTVLRRFPHRLAAPVERRCTPRAELKHVEQAHRKRRPTRCTPATVRVQEYVVQHDGDVRCEAAKPFNARAPDSTAGRAFIDARKQRVCKQEHVAACIIECARLPWRLDIGRAHAGKREVDPRCPHAVE